MNNYKSEKRGRSNGDRIAAELATMSLPEVYHRCAVATGRKVSDLYKAYSHLNTGQQRMVCGNLIRGFLKKQATPADVIEPHSSPKELPPQRAPGRRAGVIMLESPRRGRRKAEAVEA